ncbi:helical backbone metal receptor [Ascidiimonas aurantiaca]|uniref:ABC transporter substrate-binding protein n=1 Tax=Ascidiimonas aurantiaca TaxID=1685432 RepID=UPI0030EE4FE5
MITLTDQTGRELSFKEIPERIVSLVPSLTELLCELQLESELVGVTKFCVHPAHIRKEKKVVGGTKQVHYHKVAALEPDIILCNKEENTLEMVQELEKIAPVHVSDIVDIDDCIEVILQYGTLFNRKEEAHALAQNITTEKNNFLQEIQNLPSKKVAYFIWKDPWMVAGNNTFINYLLEINHFVNIYKDASRYPEVQIETLEEEYAPDYLFLSSEPFPFTEKQLPLLQTHIKKARMVLVDGEFFSWYGSRLLKAFTYFKQLHKELTEIDKE